MRSNNEYEANSTNKRGVVVERDPKKKRVKVKFEDEDEAVSMWVDVLAKSAKTTKTFMMPDVDDEVWCAMDAKGEDGCVVGSKYNDKDAPPHSTNDDIGLTWEGGSIHVNKATGAVSVTTNGPVNFTTSGKVIINAQGGIELVSPTLTHNGTDISDQHRHKDVMAGPATTGVPV